jgi:hypothetical protein
VIQKWGVKTLWKLTACGLCFCGVLAFLTTQGLSTTDVSTSITEFENSVENAGGESAKPEKWKTYQTLGNNKPIGFGASSQASLMKAPPLRHIDALENSAIALPPALPWIILSIFLSSAVLCVAFAIIDWRNNSAGRHLPDEKSR